MERFPGVSGDFEPGAEDPGDRSSCAGNAIARPLPAYKGVGTIGVPGLTKRDDDNGWIPASAPPQPNRLLARSIAVLGVVDDANYRMNGDEPFVDVVHYWPTREQWTVTHMGRGDKDADDFPVTVRCWQPMVELPPPWSALWA